jgi:hypothetical protein
MGKMAGKSGENGGKIRENDGIIAPAMNRLIN